MKFNKQLLAAGLCTLSSLATAGGFDGPSVQAGIALTAAQTELRNYSPDGKVSDNSVIGSLALGYSKAYGKLNLAGGLFALLGSPKSGSLNSFDDSPTGTGGLWSDEFKLKQVWGLSIEPGYNLSESTLVYAKLSYVQATGQNRYDYSRAPVPEGTGSAEAKHSGIGIGAGVKFKLSSKLYGVVEFQQVNFDSKGYYGDVPETYKPSLLSGSVGLGYQF